MILGITQCGHENWVEAQYVDAIMCPFEATLGPAAIILFGFAVFAGLAVYSRTATMPAVIAVLFVGIGIESRMPSTGSWVIMRYVIIVAAVLLCVVYLRTKR